VARDADDNFIGRWSKRKHAVRRGETPPEPARSEARPAEVASPPAPAPGAAPAAATPELPPIDSLQGLESDYKEFLRPEVDAATKSAALRKLFGDPHFNQMDGMDVYIDDYTKEDPIPTVMLRALNQARSLGLFDEAEKKAEAQPAPEAAEPVPAAAIGEAAPAAIQPAPVTDAEQVADAAQQPAPTEKPGPA
jgi:Protein of unknown function (DUF3306)